MHTKPALRADLRARRAKLSHQQVATASILITERVLETVDWATMKSANIYASNTVWNEVDTKELICCLQKQFPDLSIDVPGVAHDVPLPSGSYDVIVVPVLGFDAELYRLGLGSGWYDRFLAGQPQALKIGLAYDHAKQSALPHEAHDVPLDVIVTDRAVYRNPRRG